MTERKYSLSEIDEMRSMIRRRERDIKSFETDHGYSFTDVYLLAEEQLRTYMIAGLGPDDLVESVEAADKAITEKWGGCVTTNS